MDNEFIPNFDTPGANNSDSFDFNDSLTPSTLALLEVANRIPDHMETAEQAAAYLIETVAPALQDAIIQPEQLITQADAVAVSQTLMAVISIALSAGQSRVATDVVTAITALAGGR